MPVKTPRVPKETPMYDDAGNMTRTWIIFFERLFTRAVDKATESGGGAGELKATFGLVRLLTLENDLTNHFISRSAGTFQSLTANAKQPPTGSAAIFDFKKSTDEGQTWNTIFASGPIALAAGDSTRQDFTGVFAVGAAGQIAVGDFLRIDCLQIGSTFAGKDIEFVLKWE
jgi:hypothetical protein